MESSSEVLFTQQIDNSMGDDGKDEFEEGVYGLLLSMNAEHPDVALRADMVTLGRQPSCTVYFKNNQVGQEKRRVRRTRFDTSPSAASELRALPDLARSHVGRHVCRGPVHQWDVCEWGAAGEGQRKPRAYSGGMFFLTRAS